jgi:hypothetical protein
MLIMNIFDVVCLFTSMKLIRLVLEKDTNRYALQRLDFIDVGPDAVAALPYETLAMRFNWPGEPHGQGFKSAPQPSSRPDMAAAAVAELSVIQE